MNYRNRHMYIILGVLCSLVLLISIAFAALSTTMTINFGTASKGSHTWNVHFASDDIRSSSFPIQINPSVFGTSSTGRYCSQAITYQSDSFGIEQISLSKPDDKCIWNLPIKNEGTIDAYMSEIVVVNPTGGISSCVSQTTNGVNYGVICDDITITAYQCSDASISNYTVHCASYQNIVGYGDWVIQKNGNYGVLVLEAKYNSNSVNTNVYTLTGTRVQLKFSQK